MKVQKVKIDDVHPDPTNPRIGNIEAIKESLSEFGQDQNLVIREETMTIIKGNHRWKAMKDLGWKECFAMVVPDNELSAVRRGLSDNRSSDIATYDSQMLAELVSKAGGADIPAFDQGYVDDLLKSTEAGYSDVFNEVSEDIETNKQCPKCGYEWQEGA